MYTYELLPTISSHSTEREELTVDWTGKLSEYLLALRIFGGASISTGGEKDELRMEKDREKNDEYVSGMNE